MKHHIKKALAAVFAVVMLVSMIPTAVLPVFASNATGNNASGNIFENVVLGKNTVNSTVNYMAGNNGTDPAGKTVVNDSYSPYEPYSTNDEDHPFLPGGPAWIDLSQIHYGAPATQNYPLTAWSANTSVYNITGTGKKYTESSSAGKEIFTFADMDLINEYLWADQSQIVYKNYNGDGAQTDMNGRFDYATENGVLSSETNGLQVDSDKKVTGNVNHNTSSKYSDTTAYVYNRYDAMQGKWGLTLDKNVSSVSWQPPYVKDYYGTNKHLNNSLLYLSDTPYLYYSTEAVPGTKTAISLLIGTPVQDETKAADPSGYNLSITTNKSSSEYEYRWYTITDSTPRPNWESDSLDRDMTPKVYVSEPVMQDFITDPNDNISYTLKCIANGYEADDGWSEIRPVQVGGDLDRLNPIALAQNKGGAELADSLYIDGSMTGCIDFTNILPLLLASTDDPGSGAGNGREGVKYRLLQVRVDTKTDEDATDSAMRLNYLYFGPALSTVYTPQNTVGSTINAANWQYGQNAANVGVGNSEDEANNVAYGLKDANGNFIGHINTGLYSSAYTSGWVNGAAVSITNTPNDPQKITIDTLGNGDGELIINNTNSSQFCVDNQFASSFTNSTEKLGESGVWQYTVGTGDDQKTVKLEAIKAKDDWYVTVGIPVRKWVNLLGNSRKMSFTLTMEQYAEALKASDGTVISDQKLDGSYINPNFCLWGNNDGALGTGHGHFGTRFRDEDMVCVFGENGIYQLDRQSAFWSVLIDETIGQSVIYNTQIPEMFIHQDGVFETDPNFSDEKYWKYYYKGNYKAYTDGETVYYVNGKIIYKATQLTSASKPELLKYIDTVNWSDQFNRTAPAYYYNPTTGTLYNSDLTTVNTNLAITMLDPVYGMTEVTDVSLADLEPYYTDTESWIDMLRSPYVMDPKLTVRGVNDTCGITEEMYGYTYLTMMRVVVPLGAVMSIQNMKGDGNSAGLNSYSTDGAIVNAYDGGTGNQPVVSTDGTANHLTANGNNQFTANGSVSATLRNTAAAYGPYIYTSNYTIYDLLDTEELTTNNDKDNIQTRYGHPFRVTRTGGLPIMRLPHGSVQAGADYSDSTWTENRTLGFIPKGQEFMVYGRIQIPGTANSHSTTKLETWGLVGALQSNGTPIAGWVKLAFYDGTSATTETTTVEIGGWGNNKYAFDGVWDSAYRYTDLSQYEIDNQKKFTNLLKDKWIFSNAQEDLQPYYTSSASTANAAPSRAQGFDCKDVFFDNFAQAPGMVYANMKRSSYNTFDYSANADGYIKSVNSTDMKFVAPCGTSNWHGTAMTRSFSNPVVLKSDKDGMEKTWPVLHYDFTTGSGQPVRISLNMRVGNELKVYYLSSSGTLSENKDTVLYENTYCGYLSFKEIMTAAGYDISKGGTQSSANVEILGINIATSCNPSVGEAASVVFRRFEVWTDETPYLDWLSTENGAQNSAEGVSATAKMADAFNIINDAFYYVHDEESDDGSYKKNNSNRGWSGAVRVYSEDGISPAVSYKGAASKEGVYEYRTALGHLRVWVPAGRRADIVFTSDRSFSTKNYRYLYYSYSMRDVATGISAEDNDNGTTNLKDNGFAIALKSRQDGSRAAYVEREGEFAYYNETLSYTDNQGLNELKYQTTVSAAVDLSTLSGIDAINQIVVYMNNAEDKTGEFYLNYMFLSNIEPDGKITEETIKEQTQYYYLMDSTGDRYSARFPTIDNPTGQVTGANSDNSRVNPVVIKRGDRLSQGKYFNGDPIFGYGGDSSTDRTFDESTGSEGYYEKTYGSTDLTTGSMKNIMFYTGESAEQNDISDYYTYKEFNGDGVANEYDMMWSYGRWYEGSGESGMNSMYIGNPGDLGQNDTADVVSGNLTRRFATENYVLLRAGIEPKRYITYYDAMGGEFIYEGSSGDLQNLQKFTENSYYINYTAVQAYYTNPEAYAGMYQGYPIHFNIEEDGTFTNTETEEKFTATTYSVLYEDGKYSAVAGEDAKAKCKIAKFFGADGSQLTYSWEDTDRDGVIDSGEVFDHFYLQKPGYLFSHWEHIDTETGNADSNFNKVNDESTSPDGNGARLLKFTKKGKPELDYFKAIWIEDPTYADNSKFYTANFFASEEDAQANNAAYTSRNTLNDGGVSTVNGKFILTIPKTTNMIVDGERILVYGWYRFDEETGTADRSKIFSPSDKLYLLQDTKFVPATSAEYEVEIDGETVKVAIDNLFTMKVMGARLWAVTTNAKEHLVTDHGANEKPITENGTIVGYEYSNIIANRHYRARPIDGVQTGYGWTSIVKQPNPVEIENEWQVVDTAPILSNNPEYFEFYPHENLDINYGLLPSTDKKVFVSSTPSTKKLSRTMMVYTRFFNGDEDNVEIVAAGTIRAIDPNFSNFVTSNDTIIEKADINASIDAKMRLDEKSIKDTTIDAGAFTTLNQNVFRQVKASAWSKFGEFYLSSTESKGIERTYYMRGYVIYQIKGQNTYNVVYSDIVAVTGVEAISTFGTL